MSITVWKELNRIPKATLLFKDGDAAAETFPISDTDEFIPGKTIEIRAGYRSQEEVLFKGLVVKHGIKIRRDASFLQVDCYDQAIKLTVAKNSRYFHDCTDRTVLEEVLTDLHKLPADVASTVEKHESLVQFETSDWDFVRERAAASGLVLVVENGKVTAKIPDPAQAPALDVVFGSSLLELDADLDARRQPTSLKRSAWDPAAQVLSGVEAEEPTLDLYGNVPATDLAKALGQTNHQQYSAPLTDATLQKTADTELLRARLARMQGRVRCQGNVAIRPDAILTLGGVGTRFAGKAYVTGVRHHLANGNWETDAQLGWPEEPLLAPPRLESRLGLHVGVVTQIEKDPQREHRVRVRLPTIHPNNEGVWARVAALDAGPARGTFFRPELGDEVVVGFLQQEANYPVLLGMCHSSKRPAPFETQKKNPEKGYVSRSKLKLVFDDEQKTITLETPAGNKLLLSEAEEGIFLADQHGNKFSMNSRGIALESTQNLTLKAAQSTQLEALNIEAKATAGFRADGGSGCELTAGNGMTTVKGGTVMIN
nr:type VI secretion system tip protein VgrG [Rhabdobacter roseus]